MKREIQRMFSPNVIKQAHRQIEIAAASPGLIEVALLDLIIDRARTSFALVTIRERLAIEETARAEELLSERPVSISED